MSQLFNGVEYMHQMGYFHRDLKPENVLVCQDNTLKIVDFGTAKSSEKLHPYTDYVSTRWYRSPECILHSKEYGPVSDVFALGCIMAEFYKLRPVFCGDSSLD